MGWQSAVGKVQHLHRRMVTTGVVFRDELDPSVELLRGKRFLVQKPPPPSLWWNVYVDNFDIGEIMSKGRARKLVRKPSMSKIFYKRYSGSMRCPGQKRSLSLGQRKQTP